MDMVLSAVRTLVQAGWAQVVLWAGATLGVTLPSDAPDWVQAAVWAGVTLGVTYALRWLESHTGAGWVGRALRGWARLMMLGIKLSPGRYRATTPQRKNPY